MFASPLCAVFAPPSLCSAQSRRQAPTAAAGAAVASRACSSCKPFPCRSSRGFRVAAHPDAAAAPADDTETQPRAVSPPNIIDWASLRADIVANAGADILFDEGDDDDDEDEDVIYYRNRIKEGESAAEEDTDGDGRWVERQLVSAEEAAKTPVPGGPEALVSSYSSDGGFREIGPEELYALLQEQGAAHRTMLLLDIRSTSEYTSGRAVGAYNVPFPQLSEVVRSGLLDGWKRRALVVLGDTDLTSAQAGVRLRRVFGFESVVCVRGGMPAWVLAGLPVETGADAVDWAEVFSSPA